MHYAARQGKEGFASLLPIARNDKDALIWLITKQFATQLNSDGKSPLSNLRRYHKVGTLVVNASAHVEKGIA